MLWSQSGSAGRRSGALPKAAEILHQHAMYSMTRLHAVLLMAYCLSPSMHAHVVGEQTKLPPVQAMQGLSPNRSKDSALTVCAILTLCRRSEATPSSQINQQG